MFPAEVPEPLKVMTIDHKGAVVREERMVRSTGLYGVLGAFLFLGNTAYAQSADSSAHSDAVQLFDAGQELLDSGKISEACPKFAESYRLDPALGALMHLADCLERDGKLASAYASFKDAAEIAQTKGDDRQKLAEDRVRALAPRLSRLTVAVDDAGRVPDLQILRDGRALASGSWGTPIAVDAGEHTVEARAPGYAPWQGKVTITGEGSAKEVRIPPLEPLSADAASSPTKAEASAAPASSSGGGSNTLAYVSFGVGVLGLGAGTFFALQAKSNYDEANDLCPSSPCNLTRQQAQEREDLGADGDGQSTLSIVGFVAGGIGIAAGTTLLLIGGGSEEKPAAGLTLKAYAALNGAGLAGRF